MLPKHSGKHEDYKLTCLAFIFKLQPIANSYTYFIGCLFSLYTFYLLLFFFFKSCDLDLEFANKSILSLFFWLLPSGGRHNAPPACISPSLFFPSNSMVFVFSSCLPSSRYFDRHIHYSCLASPTLLPNMCYGMSTSE